MNKSFAISNNILMNKSTLMMYTDYLLNKCYQFKTENAVGKSANAGDKTGDKTGSQAISLFCSVYCDNCNGSCVNSRYSLVNSRYSLVNSRYSLMTNTNPSKPANECSKMCYDNVYNDCICL
jgi:hypothetical protein